MEPDENLGFHVTGVYMPFFIWKGSKVTKDSMEALVDSPLYDGSLLSLGELSGAISYLKKRFGKDLNDTLVAHMIGILASSLPSGNLLANILGVSPPIYKSLPLICGGIVNPWLRPEQSCLVIHTCRNGCIAYCNKYAEAEVCPKCKLTRVSDCPVCKEPKCQCPKSFISYEKMYFFPLSYRMR